MAAEHDVLSVLGTPSAAPPAWLTHKYPEVLCVDVNGHRAQHGRRQHYSPASPLYTKLSARIAEQMAERFGDNPHVMGWQIDNEFGPVSYDDETRRQWQQWLKAKHVTLDALNDHWSATFWSQEYSEWEQIPLPAGFDSPQLALDFRKFITSVFKSFQRAQIEAIRKHSGSRQWITHNFMGICVNTFDHYELCEDLDFASWDNYIWGGVAPYRSNACSHAFMRSLKRRNFWMMETQIGRTCASCSVDKGATRTFTWHHVGHGADAVLYWEWRAAPGGQEYDAGVAVGQDGRPTRIFAEVQQIGSEFAKVSPILDGTQPVSQVAILHPYEDRWLIDAYRYQNDFDPINHTTAYHNAVRELTHEVDFARPTDPLNDYKLVIAPQLQILDDARVRNLTRYVKSGGHLVLGARSGGKDEHGRWLPERQPGPLAGLLGAHVDEFYSLNKPAPVTGPPGNGEGTIWADLLQVDSPEAEVLLRYGACNGWLDGEPAMVSRKAGQGRITYLGTWLDGPTMQLAAAWMVEASDVEPPFGRVPDGVELCRRVGNDREVFILINHGNVAQRVTLPRPLRDMLTDQAFEHSAELAPLGVMVLT